MEQKLSLVIGAEIGGYLSAIQIAQNQLTRLQKIATSSDLGAKQVERVTKLMYAKQAEIDRLKKAYDVLGSSTGRFAKGTSEATTALTNLSRVAQDAPYGFIGIANNINPLLESFQRLKKETGSMGGAFKALSAELLGGGGLGLAVGVISSLLVVFGDSLFGASKATKSAKESLDDYVDSLNDLDKARVKGLQSAQEELVKLQTLYNATQNANIPIKERRKLVDELQEQYPKYFKNISDEIILAGGAANAYNQLKTAIIAAAKARAAQDSIVDIQKQSLAVEDKLSKNTIERLKLQQQIDKNKALPQTEILGGREIISDAAKKASEAQKTLNDRIAEGNELRKQKNDLDQRSNQLAGVIQRNVQQNPEALLNPTGSLPTPKVDKSKEDKEKKELEKALQEKKDILLEFVKDFETLKIPFPKLSKPLEEFDAKGLTDELRGKLTDALLNQPLRLKVPVEIEAIDPKKVPIPLKPSVEWKDTDLHKQLEAFSKMMDESIRSTIVGLAEGIGAAVGTLLTGGGVGDAFKSLFRFIGDAVAGLGERMIALSPVIAALKAGIKSLNPAILLPAGIALVAIGGLLKGIQPRGFAKGGDVPGSGNGDTVPAMLTPGEYVATKQDAPLVKAFLKLVKGGLPTSKLFGGVQHFALGGEVNPARFIQQSQNIFSTPQTNFTPAPITVNVKGRFEQHGNSLVSVIDQTYKMQRRSF